MDKQKHLLELMATNEKTISDLYLKYAEMFPEDKNFWEHLSNDELLHEAWIKNFIKELEKGTVSIDPDRLSESALTAYSKYLTLEAEREGLDRLAAVSICMEIERSLLEKDFFVVVDTDSVKLKTLLDQLEQATEIHLEEVKKKWEEVKALAKA